MPYSLIFVILRNPAGIFDVAAAYYADQSLAFPKPKKELDDIDSTPPPRCKNIWIHKSRLFMANSDRFPARVWWSKQAFFLDAFDQTFDLEDFSTTKGGRVTAGGELLNQSIVLTEDQLYGIADVDSDAFQSYPISPGDGCVAGDSFVVGDGVAMWLSSHGVLRYRGGDTLPEKVSKEMDRTFSRMSFEKHGWSRAVIHEGQYELWLVKPNTIQPTDGYRYDILMERERADGIGSWSTVGYSATARVLPFAVVTAPLGTIDAGVRHAFLAPQPLGASGSFRVYLGELSLLDDTSVIGVNVEIHFGPPGYKDATLDRAIFYYDAPNGWDTPLVIAPSASEIGYDFDSSGIGTATPDTGTDYSRIIGVFKFRASGTKDVVLRFTANSVAGGTLWGQRLMGAYLLQDPTEPKR